MQGKYFLTAINEVDKFGLVFSFQRKISQVKLEEKIPYISFLKLKSATWVLGWGPNVAVKL